MFWSWAPRARFYRQLGGLVRSGLALDVALPLAGDAAGGDYRARSRAWGLGCARGRPLAEQLEGEPPTVRALVLAGERTGRLPEVCETIADLTDQARQVRSALLNRLWYPGLLLHAVLILPGLPGLVQGTTSMAGFLAGPVILWALIGSAFVAWRLGLESGLLARIALFGPIRFLTLPLLGHRLCLVAGAAHAAGFLHRQALDLAAEACGNRYLAAAVHAAALDLEVHRLSGMADALAQAGFDPTTVALVRSGEVGGRLTDSLAHAARHNRERFAIRIDLTVRIGSGLLYGLIALLVAMTVIRMYMGLYSSVLTLAETE